MTRACAKLLYVSRTLVLAVAAVALAVSACSARRPRVPVNTAPRYPTYTQPAIPVGLVVPPAILERYDAGWLRLQAGDLRAAIREFSEITKQAPGFYPAATALGQVALIERDFKEALGRFTAAVERNNRYLPALDGRVQAALALGDDLTTAGALEQLLRADPSRDEARSRLDLVRLRIVQGQLTAAVRARGAGRLDEAEAIVERALETSPPSPVLLRELVSIEAARGALDAAAEHARRAVELDSADPESIAALAAVLEAQGRTSEAAEMFGRAVNLDPRPAWRERRDALRNRAAFEALPAEYREIPGAATVTRAQVAAVIGIDLEPLVARAPRKAAAVMTDVRAHWAARWILPVTQAGIMDVFPNHTFQPNTPVRRSDLAQVTSQLINITAAGRPEEVARWRAARPRLEDVSADHASYRAIALALSAGVMTLDSAGRFWPARAASGADVAAAVARVKQLAR